MFLSKSLQKILCILSLGTCSVLAVAEEFYKVATDPYFEPYTFKNETGVIGFNRDIMEAIGEDQGFSTQFVEGKWPEIFGFVKAGKEDMVMSWVVKGNPATEGFLCSDPYISVPKSGIAYLNDYFEFNGLESLRNYRIGVNIKGSDEPYLRANGINNLKEGKTLFELFRWTGQGQIDAFVGDRLVLEYMAKKYNNRVHNNKTIELKVKPLYQGEENAYQPLVVCFRPTDTQLAEKFNTGLKNIKDSGRYQTIVTKWFGEDAPVR